MGATPFYLIYGEDVIMPLELEIPSLCVSLKYFIPDQEAQQAQLNQLALLDERHINAIEHHNIYQEHLKRAFNKKSTTS